MAVDEVKDPPPWRRTRLISEAPSARNLKPRKVSALHHRPPGCGRFPAPPTAPSPSSAPAPSPQAPVLNTNVPSPAPPPWPPTPASNLKINKKIILKTKKVKVVAKKNANLKLGQNPRDRMPAKETALVSFQIGDRENLATDPSTNDPITLSQDCPTKSVMHLSRPCPTKGKTKKQGYRVAKKSVEEDSPSAQQNNSMPLTLLAVAPFDGEKLCNTRGMVKKILRLFHIACTVWFKQDKSRSGKQQQNLTGSKSDVEMKGEFHFRVELQLIGLHRPLDLIDWTESNGMPVATCIVASGGYSDRMVGSDMLYCTGRKGQITKPGVQKLEMGNLALKNSMDMKTPVQVIYGLNTSLTSNVLMTFTYDGLYLVEELKKEPETYEIDKQVYTTQVFRYKLKRIEAQPELGLLVATNSKKSKVRGGLCVPDISQGKEKIPISAINAIDDQKPPAFEYATGIMYPSWYKKTAPMGCDCTDNCSSSESCLCAMKNKRKIPFNFNGAIVQAKPLIYECGPSCRCPPSCHNRVGQSGIKIPLEIFKTESRGWGVRSLSSIQSGSFVCEYVGELLRDEEAEGRGSDEYFFGIGPKYDDTGLRPTSAEDSGDSVSEGFTIDAAAMGNVGRFINHSCSPNLFGQNVFFDHDDRRMPHIMFFAAKKIPPLEELTYNYNYKIGKVKDSKGNKKIKKCYCGSSECQGRLY